jgi:hypothetical protein
MTGFKREVAMLALPVLTFIAIALSHFTHANAATTSWVTAAFIAAGTVITSALATPRSMTAIGGAVLALLTILAHYWWHLPPAELAPLIIAIQTLFGMHVRSQATPVFAPASASSP